MVTIDSSNYFNDANSKILIECDLKLSQKCKGKYLKVWREVLKNRAIRDEKDVCFYCANYSFNSGSLNSAFKYHKNESFFNEINSEIQAYILGLIAGDG